MVEATEVFYSNRLEWLGDQLAEQLFADNSGPFAKRWVVVPTPAIKNWIQFHLADHPRTQIAAGVRFLFLEEAVLALAGLPRESVMSREEISLKVDAFLRKTPLEGVFASVAHFLEKNPKRRLPFLSARLADHFLEYGLYGKEMVEKWGDSDGWQEQLWKAIFKDGRYWAKVLEGTRPRATAADTLHLFGFSHIPPVFYRFLKEASPCLYVLSPCVAFWADIRSDRESRALMRRWKEKGTPDRQLQELDRYLRSRNRLLANFGRLGRQLVDLIEDEEACEEYFVPKQIRESPHYADYDLPDVVSQRSGNPTALQVVQTDMLLLREPKLGDPIPIGVSDRSIALHRAPSLFREVELLHQAILEALADERLEPKDVIVMTPDIEEYAPFIRAVFQGRLQAEILAPGEPDLGSIEEGFASLIALAESRWEVSKIRDILRHPLFRKTQGLSLDEVARLERWIEEAGVRFGRSDEHRREWFERAYGVSDVSLAESTWRQGFQRLLCALAAPTDGIYLEVGAADLLERLMGWLGRLEECLRPIETEQELPLAAWMQQLDAICVEFLGAHLPNKSLLEGLADRLPDRYPFSSLNSLICAVPKSTYRSSNLQLVRFSSLGATRALPSEIVCLIGMHDGAFPKAAPKQPLNLLHRSAKRSGYPSRSEFDRYLFLEALLSARRRLIITYTGVSPDDGGPVAPSILVSELTSYLDEAVSYEGRRFSGARILVAPQLACLASNFPVGNRQPVKQYRRALALYGQKVHPAPTVARLAEQSEVVLLSDLKLAVRDPLRLYLQALLKTSPSQPKGYSELDQETLWPDALQQHRLFAESLGGTEAAPWRLPPEPFATLVRLKLQERHGKMAQVLRVHDLTTSDLFTLELSPTCERAEWVQPGRYRVPSPKLGGCPIVGEISLVSTKGLVRDAAADLRSACLAWPEYLVFAAACEQSTPFERRLLLTRDGRSLEPLFDEAAPALERLVTYAERCKREPFSLNFTHLPLLATGDTQALNKALSSQQLLPLSEEFCLFAKETFGPIRGWFS